MFSEGIRRKEVVDRTRLELVTSALRTPSYGGESFSNHAVFFLLRERLANGAMAFF